MKILHKFKKTIKSFFRKGNYPGALSSFKKAYLGDTDSSAVQFHFALALAGAGDFRNADRAFSAALEDRAPFEL